MELLEEIWHLDRSTGRQLSGRNEVTYERWRRGTEPAEISGTTAVIIEDLGAIDLPRTAIEFPQYTAGRHPDGPAATIAR